MKFSFLNRYTLPKLPEDVFHENQKEQKEEKPRQFINESGLEFIDISSEIYREYNFPNGKQLLINHPLYLHISESGGHRLFTRKGISYYIRVCEGWYIEWEAKPGEPNFVK